MRKWDRMRVTVSEKGQIVIPAEIRHAFGIERGTKLEVRKKAGIIEIEPLPKHPILLLRGKLKGRTSLTKELLRERTGERERENAD